MEDEESLQPATLVAHPADAIHDVIDELLADRVVAAGVIVGRVFYSAHQLIRMEQLPVGSVAHLIDNAAFCIDEDGAWNISTLIRFPEEGIKRDVITGVIRNVPIRLDSMFQAVELPAAVAYLNTGLADVNRYAFTL